MRGEYYFSNLCLILKYNKIKTVSVRTLESNVAQNDSMSDLKLSHVGAKTRLCVQIPVPEGLDGLLDFFF